MSSVKGGSIIKYGGLFNPHIIRLLFALLMAMRNDAISLMLEDAKFDENYKISWGDSHVTLLDNRREVQLSMDKYLGAEFVSRRLYSSGFFAASIKLPTKNSNGVVTSFYLSSQVDGQSGNHDELDFEFLGGPGPNYTLQTNVFSLDSGGREQRINLWFDPTQNFHTYAILWNQHHIVFYVDNKPIRVFKNDTESGVVFPTKEMCVRASMWNGESWAGQQGKKIDWSQSPFLSRYRGLGLQGCPCQNPREKCFSTDFWWNKQEFWSLDAKKQKEYENVMRSYLIYDYCWKGLEKHKECLSPLKKY